MAARSRSALVAASDRRFQREDLLNHLMRERCLRRQLEQELKEREQFIQELQQSIKELRPKQQASAEVANTTALNDFSVSNDSADDDLYLFHDNFASDEDKEIVPSPRPSTTTALEIVNFEAYSFLVYTRCSKLMQTGIPDSQSLPSVQHTYNKSAGFADMSGEWYEIKMATLLFLRGLNYTEDFFLATNFDGAELSENKEVSEKLTKLKLKPCKDELEKLIKEIEPWGDLSKYSEFLGKFKMLTGQASESQLDYLIKQEIVKLFQTPELETDLIFADLKERMQNWWKDGSSNYYLTKSASLWLDLMKSRIMELSLPEWQMLKNLDIQYCQDQVHILGVDITENRVVNIFASGRSTKLTCLKVYQAMATIQGDRYLFLSLGTSLARQGEVLSVWQSVWCDMLVVDCDPTSDNPKILFDNFAKILQNNKHKKLIFITLPSDVKLSNSIRNIILDGYKKLIIGEALTDIVEYYVPRTLQRQHFLKKSVLKDSDSVSVFAISGTTKDGERTDTFINNLLHLTSQYLNDKDRHFTGIPLQTLLLAEVFENDLRVYQESKQFNFHEECDLFLLYDRFVEKKWDVYLSEKKKEDTSNIGVQRDNEDLKNIFMSNHMIAALLRILSPKDLSVLKYKDLQVKGSRFIGRVEQGYDHTGIILGITDGVPRFVHHTFAEYFTAKWFAMNFSENRNFVEHNFWESSYEVVKSIFDRILANDSDLHIAVLRNDVVAVTDLLEKGAEVNFRDLGGRSALHLAAVQKNGEDIIEILIKYGADIHLVDEVLQWTALRYADKVRAWSVIGVILQNKGNTNDLVFTKQTFCDGDYIISALHITAKGGYIELLEFLLYTDKYINISLDNDRYSLLHVAAQYGQRGVLELLLAKGANILCKDKNENTPMHFASKNGHLGVVQCLVERMESKKFDKEYYRYINLVLEGINSKDKQGKTPLFIASEHNHLEVVKYLTEKGADVEICSRDGYSPLYIALLKGNTNVIYFLKDVATVDKGSKNGWTLMHTASTNGHLNVIEHLLKISANINACNKYGQTPLHIAAKKNNVKVLQFLIQEGALVNVHDKTFGWTPLNYAIQEGYLDIVEHLLNAGSELDVCEKNNTAQSESNDQVGMVNHLTDMETGLIIPNKMNSWAPLFLASWYGHLDIVKVLTVKGAQLDVCEKTSGRSALHIAAEKNHISVAEHLIEKGADINICGQLGGLTPLHVASQRGNVEMVMLLIEKGAHMEIQDRINGQTPLHNAAWCCHFELAKCLINKGANINATDDCGWTPMHIAAEKNHLDMVQLLVEYGANINTRTNTYDWTPLHYAAKYGRSDIVEFLIKNKAELEVHDAMRGQIALHIAAENSHLHVIKQLVEGGTSVQVRDSNGMTALDIALAQNDKLMVEYLKPLTDPIIPRT
uniref:Uncharacterized protein n=1 Tax=Timema tahoe TaxID=61484 RepID=A0A7R9IRB0_9NEOP|nr:unnamed protein product [Timema tahoe]